MNGAGVSVGKMFFTLINILYDQPCEIYLGCEVGVFFREFLISFKIEYVNNVPRAFVPETYATDFFRYLA